MTRTPEQAKRWLRDQGKSVPEFCREEGLDERIVYDLLNGRVAGTRGKAHRAAVALGLKPVPDRPAAPGVSGDEARALELAKAAIQALEGTGIHVIGLIAMLPRPVIAVRNSTAVEALGGTLVFSLGMDADVRCCYVAEYLGCLVRWFIVSHVPRRSLFDLPEGFPWESRHDDSKP